MTQQPRRHLKSRLVMLGFIIILFAAAVWLIGTGLSQDRLDAQIDEATIDSGQPSLPIGINEIEQSAEYIQHLGAISTQGEARDLSYYYSLRAYDGAPPIIPHEVSDVSFGANDCLQCHATGDYVPQLEAYAPIVPHPELLSCTQCHVADVTTELFAESDWTTIGRPTLNQAALEGGPPPIPHELDMRSDCLSCHAGPAAPAEIRFTHPERESCLQCHVPIETDLNEEWER